MFNGLPRNARYVWQGIIRSAVGAAVAGACWLAYRLFWMAATAPGYAAVGFFLSGIACLIAAGVSVWWIGGGRFGRK